METYRCRYSSAALLHRAANEGALPQGLSIKNNNCKRWKKKQDLITISARKYSREWPVLNQIGQLPPLGCGSNQGVGK